jgi:hypothetical protein
MRGMERKRFMKKSLKKQLWIVMVNMSKSQVGHVFLMKRYILHAVA